MDRSMLERHLRQAETHVAQGDRQLARQRELVAELERDGHDTAVARALLAELEHLQELHIDHRDRLSRELSKTSTPAP